MQATKNNVYTVSRLNSEVRDILEGQLGKVWLNGEISNFSSPSSGHWYLTLKDSRSQIRCAMFKGRNQAVRFYPSNGQQVLVKGAISVYEPRGDYQLLIESMLPAGDGLLAQEYEALKMKLAAEGLFAADTKRPLPDTIQRVGIITSATGAALHDVLHVLQRRDPSVEVIIYPTQVQGSAASASICQAIETANRRLEVDVLLLTRGGGSLEDLWCFNNELLAHTIYNSALPVVSAVGHEVDITISDYVADLRAPTPSAAAELLSKDKGNKAEKLHLVFNRLKQSMRHYHLSKQAQLTNANHQLQRQDPQRRLQQFEQSFDELQMRLQAAFEQKVSQLTFKQQQLQHRLQQRSPKQYVQLEAQRLDYLSARLTKVTESHLQQATQRMAQAAHQLETVSPLATLSRGYSITKNAQGKVVTNATELTSGDTINTTLAKGELVSVVK
ncbi:exodeoxyribonuclease VII large subunit [Shewanella maritima]|uniref:exodeoxyribonuclease VII large subunit n=1 Tax=Shewanella maritima TaxID=2520507 RepID=UPI00373699D2